MTSVQLRDRIILIAMITTMAILTFILMLICILYGGGRDPSCIATQAGCVKASSSGNKTAPAAPKLIPAYAYFCGINCLTCSPVNAIKSTDVDPVSSKLSAYAYCKTCNTGFTLNPATQTTKPDNGLVTLDYYCSQ